MNIFKNVTLLSSVATTLNSVYREYPKAKRRVTVQDYIEELLELIESEEADEVWVSESLGL